MPGGRHAGDALSAAAAAAAVRGAESFINTDRFSLFFLSLLLSSSLWSHFAARRPHARMHPRQRHGQATDSHHGARTVKQQSHAGESCRPPRIDADAPTGKGKTFRASPSAPFVDASEGGGFRLPMAAPAMRRLRAEGRREVRQEDGLEGGGSASYAMRGGRGFGGDGLGMCSSPPQRVCASHDVRAMGAFAPSTRVTSLGTLPLPTTATTTAAASAATAVATAVANPARVTTAPFLPSKPPAVSLRRRLCSAVARGV
jgi:hypothetical protein